jgi:hypothetical protein
MTGVGFSMSCIGLLGLDQRLNKIKKKPFINGGPFVRTFDQWVAIILFEQRRVPKEQNLTPACPRAAPPART